MEAVLDRDDLTLVEIEPVDAEPDDVVTVLETLDFDRLLAEMPSDFRRPVIACNIQGP